MRGRLWCLLGFLLGATPGSLQGQVTDAVARAQEAYDALAYEDAIETLNAVLGTELPYEDRVLAFEILAYSHAALGQQAEAVDAFKEFIFLAPDREPNPLNVSPRITNLYINALNQVLVIRRVRVDSASFVAGEGTWPISFNVPRAAFVTARIVGNGEVIWADSLATVQAGDLTARWPGFVHDTLPAPPGDYTVIVDARSATGDQYSVTRNLEVRHSAVDTVDYITEFEDRPFLPETEQPGRNFRPLGITALYAGVAAVAAIVLESTELENPPRRELGGSAVVALGVGLGLSLKKPDARSIPAAIQYNDLLRDNLVEENERRRLNNEERKTQVRLTILPMEQP